MEGAVVLMLVALFVIVVIVGSAFASRCTGQRINSKRLKRAMNCLPLSSSSF
jgi:hypothetical protein